MQVNDELAHLWWKRIPGFSRPALLPRGEEALHPVAFKRVSFAGQGALGDIDFFGSLPCGLVEQNEGSDLLVQLLLRPQRPLLDACPLIGARSALSLRSRHLPLPFPDNDAWFKRTESLTGLQEFGVYLARLDTQCLPGWSSHLRIPCYETVSVRLLSHLTNR